MDTQSTTNSNYMYVDTPLITTIHNPYLPAPQSTDKYRRQRVRELTDIIESLIKVKNKGESGLEAALNYAIYTILDELYPGTYDDICEDQAREELKVIHTDNVHDEVINKVVVEKKLFNYHNATQLLFKDYVSKLARVKWDNTLNEEYIDWTIAGGIVKHYHTTGIDYYKKVEHSFRPTKEDLEATDWYII